jgi:hypothetical protein
VTAVRLGDRDEAALVLCDLITTSSSAAGSDDRTRMADAAYAWSPLVVRGRIGYIDALGDEQLAALATAC